MIIQKKDKAKGINRQTDKTDTIYFTIYQDTIKAERIPSSTHPQLMRCELTK